MTPPAPPGRTDRHRHLWTLLLLGGLALCLATPGLAQGSAAGSKVRVSPQPHGYAAHAEAMAFADRLDEAEGWNDGWARRWLGEARQHAQVVRLITPPPPGTAKNWAAYRARFVEPTRLEAGRRFWQAHADTLARAEQVYGVPAWLVVGIIGVETLYGQHTGRFRALDALATLAFDFPAAHPRAAQRSAFFRDELAALLRLSRHTGTAPTEWLGSYAGAMGLPQFMPSNWQRFGVDFDGDGRVDLLGSAADAIGSVARYMQGHGWQTGMPTHYGVRFDTERLALPTLLAPDILPTFSAEQMATLGVQLEGAGAQHTRPLALVELENGDPARGGAPRTYVAGTENFYAITRYNWSSYYAMAVIDLGLSVQALWQR
jgi:membrane-bound lytic murein transglycosylase B